MLRILMVLALIVSTVALVPAAHAQEAGLQDDDPWTGESDGLEGSAPVETVADEGDPVLEHVRFEGTMGFVGGVARYSEVGFTGEPAPGQLFDAGPAALLPMVGMRYDLRLVVAFIRMTAGADVLFGLFDGSSGGRLVGSASVVDNRFFHWTLRFGLGLELEAGPVRLFLDALVVTHFVEAEVSVDGEPAGYDAVAASPGLRLGVRIPIVDAFFAQIEIDGVAYAPSWGGAALSVGAAIE